MPQTRKGLIIINTGPGKGKTTAAMGTALRAVGQGLRVLVVQFLKGSWHCGELDAARMLGEYRLKIIPMGRGFVRVGDERPDPENVRLVEEAWKFAADQIERGAYDLIVLDEINYAISYLMLAPQQVLEALRNKPEGVHVILTGRDAHPALVELADLVTEMQEVKHPFHQGVKAQRGIEY